MSGSKLKAKSQRTPRKPVTKKRRVHAEATVTPQDFLAQVNGNIQGEYVSQYQWQAYGPAAIFVDAALPVELGSAQVIIDLTTNQICEMHACDYTAKKKNQAWRWINPKYRQAYELEARVRCARHRLDQFAWDRERWVSVTPERILKRARELYLRAEGTTKKKTRRGTP